MIVLTEHQRKAIRDGDAVRVRDNEQDFVLLRPDIYERLCCNEIDNTPWTADEMDFIREESVGLLDQFGRQP